MGKNTKVSLEVFGEKRLTGLFSPAEIKGKSIEGIVRQLLDQNCQGEDAQTQAIIRREMGANNQYSVEIGVQKPNDPIEFQPVRLGEDIEKYSQDLGGPEYEVRISVTGDHDVGYK